MSLQAEFNFMESGLWADPDPKECPCHGHGYTLSDLDTWHQCPIHWTPETRHPEDDYYDEERRESTQCLEGMENATNAELAEVEFKPAQVEWKPPTDDEIPF